ncbi:phasin family protein [Roseomonas haemaphysalidis]|uniref:Phasin family protein n=1 Tax=Roseomonas haemaphysalidis TaxID=2768162 RepID=A0ABS3KQH6_9PROT|nr:phasin family protein [Roseomonas haemaphysalidis]MBO1079724.1 phasin family protein [Roseomonas haemaphysalidis]
MAGTTNVTKLAGKATTLAAETVRKVAEQNAAQVEKAIETGAANTLNTLEKTPMDQMTQTADTMQKGAEDVAEFGRGNVEAFTKATQTYMAGLQDLSRQAFSMMQGFGEQSIENAKALSSVRSVKEAAELNTAFLKSAMEKSVSETTKLNEAAFKLAEQASAPIAARWTLAMEKMTKPAIRM